MKKKKLKKLKTELQFPKQLSREDLFKCPIWYGDEPGFVNELNNASDKYIEESKKNLKETIDKRNKKVWKQRRYGSCVSFNIIDR